MAAVLPFLEDRFEDDDENSPPLSAFGGVGEEALLASSHTELTQTYWTRRAIEEEVAKRGFRVDQDGEDFWISFTDPATGEPWPMEKDVVPWNQLPSAEGFPRVGLLSTNSKMRCSTFDLPAGAFTLGGTCPASSPAQSTSAAPGKKSYFPLLQPNGREEETEVDIQKAVCQRCYASGSEYKKGSTQLAEVAHYQFVRSLMDQNDGDKFVEVMVEAIIAAKYPLKGHSSPEAPHGEDLSDRFGIKPVRVHSSGDFFSPEYADLWIDIAVRLSVVAPNVRLWAPTRTHVVANFRRFWPDALKRIPIMPDGKPNFVIRPSGYHIGDTAPEMPPGCEGPRVAKGTSVLSHADSVKHEGEYWDHQCQVYALKAGNKTCAIARSPSIKNGGDGQLGCRACWERPDLRVNYVAH